MTTRPPITARNPNIDLLRGWLILLVVVGHIVLGSVHDNFVRYAIYAFHMPLFIGLTGYLINPEKLIASSLFAVISRYWWRIGLPFALAFIFFTGILLFHAHQEQRLDQALLMSYVVTPYYHLWFVPTLILWVLAFWLLLKLRASLLFVLVIALTTSVLWAAIPDYDLPAYVDVLLSKKVFYFFSFFLFGAWLRTAKGQRILHKLMVVKVLPVAVVLMSASIYLVQIGAGQSVLKALAWLIMNITFIAIGVHWARLFQHPRTGAAKPVSKGPVSKVLIAMGRISLPIYLWHVVPMFLLKGYDLHQSNPALYYAISIASVSLIVAILIRLEGKLWVSNKLLYGT